MSKTVLITGGGGFIGRYVTEELVEHGYTVRIFDSFVEQVHGKSGTPRSDDVECIVGDVRDRTDVARALEDVDHVVHLAAEVGVGQSMYEIARYIGANDYGTAVLLDALVERPVRSIVVASSMSVYGEGRYVAADGTPRDEVRRRKEQLQQGVWTPLDEAGAPLSAVATDERKPVDLASIYALSKHAQERAVLLIGEAYGLHAVALRLFNVFGSGQALGNPYTGVLANFASRLANGQPPTIFEDGEQRRDFVHVRDVARGFRLALERPRAGGHVINIGSGRDYSIKAVAMLLAEAMGLPEMRPEILHRARIGDIRHCFADISKARELLGFDPRYDLRGSLGEFVDWVVSNEAVDRGPEMRQNLEKRGLVA